MEQTKAKSLNITEFPYKEYDNNGNLIYCESSCGFWSKRAYDKKGNIIYYGNSDGKWYKQVYDNNDKEISYEDFHGDYWTIDMAEINPFLHENRTL